MALGEEILQELDDTLDRLIQNAEAMKQASDKKVSSYEKTLFKKTQESLLAHLIQTDQKWEERRSELKHFSSEAQKFPIQKKWIHIQKMHGKSFEVLSKKMGVFSVQRRKGKKLVKKDKAL